MQLIEPGEKVLLHSCCATCTAYIIEALLAAKVNPIVFFYNPNIDSLEEYEKRCKDVEVFSKMKNVKFIKGDYDDLLWQESIKGLEAEPEGGDRCKQCFFMRLKKSCEVANEQGINIVATSLGISRWKNLDNVNVAGNNATELFSDIIFWPENWRKSGGSQKMYEISKQQGFYRQTYCGCRYSKKKEVSK